MSKHHKNDQEHIIGNGEADAVVAYQYPITRAISQWSGDEDNHEGPELALSYRSTQRGRDQICQCSSATYPSCRYSRRAALVAMSNPTRGPWCSRR
jgi:hypothetical protein